MDWRVLLLMALALACSHAATYLLGEWRGSKHDYEPLPSEAPRPLGVVVTREDDTPGFLELEAVTVETQIVPTPSDYELTVRALEQEAQEARAEAERQERLKQQHIKEKAKLKADTKSQPVVKVRRK